MTEKLPWGVATSQHVLESRDSNVPESLVELGLYHVTGPYGLESYALAKTGQDAILAHTHGDLAPWSSARVFDDQCQAEYMGQRVLPRTLWNHFLAAIESPFGLVIQPSL